MHWFSYYQKWTPQENFYYCKKHTGFELNNLGRSEGTYTKYASLDDKADGFHFLFILHEVWNGQGFKRRTRH